MEESIYILIGARQQAAPSSPRRNSPAKAENAVPQVQQDYAKDRRYYAKRNGYVPDS